MYNKSGTAIDFAFRFNGSAQSFDLSFNKEKADTFRILVGVERFVKAEQFTAVPCHINTQTVVMDPELDAGINRAQ